MKKFFVRLGLRDKDVPEKVLFGNHVVTCMFGNVYFLSPNPYTLVQLQAATNEMSVAYDHAQGGSMLATAILHLKTARYETVMTAMGNYVDSIAQGSETIILSAGMETAKQKEPAPRLGRVTGLETYIGARPGEIRLEWDILPYARVYLVYMRADSDPADAWQMIKVCFPTDCLVSGLESGRRYWFKVQAHGTAGESEASDVATSLAY